MITESVVISRGVTIFNFCVTLEWNYLQSSTILIPKVSVHNDDTLLYKLNEVK